jgi:hypothetical protein
MPALSPPVPVDASGAPPGEPIVADEHPLANAQPAIATRRWRFRCIILIPPVSPDPGQVKPGKQRVD